VRLFCDLVQRGYQTLVFTRARQGTEQYANWCDSKLRKSGEHELADQVTAYPSALQDERRTTIEAGLRDGSVRGVWSTNALELGIDVGSLDVVLLDGHPGTSMSTFQRAGRAGRGESESRCPRSKPESVRPVLYGESRISCSTATLNKQQSTPQTPKY